MKKEKKHNKTKYGKGVLLCVCVVVLLFALKNIVNTVGEYRRADSIYSKAEKTFVKSASNQNRNQLPKIDFEGLLSINRDIIGWIYIEDTRINYPILKGEDNNQYLFQSYDKRGIVSGSIFMDYRCNENFQDGHTVIYGHNMGNGGMFGGLNRYEKESYLEKHPYVYIIMPSGSWNKYKVVSCHTADIMGETYDLPMKGEGKKVMSLSTCTEDSRDDIRFVVDCVLIEQG